MMVMTGLSCKREKQPNGGVEKKWVVTTIAGEGTGAFEDGAALSAKFSHPFDVVVAADGAIYVTDLDNRRIRKIKDGQVSTFAGSGNRGIVNAADLSAQFISPYHIAPGPGRKSLHFRCGRCTNPENISISKGVHICRNKRTWI